MDKYIKHIPQVRSNTFSKYINHRIDTVSLIKAIGIKKLHMGIFRCEKIRIGFLIRIFSNDRISIGLKLLCPIENILNTSFHRFTNRYRSTETKIHFIFQGI
jgi:hypothetical protein